ncbi:MAG TPA: TolC family protein, partial [Isosphaeraceae bacterium]|nr:TolC family protein [Isosphaeraceae bacterium]
AHQALEVASSDYQAARVDYLTLITAWREVLQIELQVAQLETSLGQSLASLERAVGVQLSEHPIEPASAPTPPPIPPAAAEPSPFPPIPENDRAEPLPR